MQVEMSPDPSVAITPDREWMRAMRRQLTPPEPSPEFLERLTPDQRDLLAASRQRAARFHQIEISKGLGPEKPAKAEKLANKSPQ